MDGVKYHAVYGRWLIKELHIAYDEWGPPRGLHGEEYACHCRRWRFDPWVGKIPWRRAWQPTPVSLPGESHGQRSLVGYSLWGRKESDTTERYWVKDSERIFTSSLKFTWSGSILLLWVKYLQTDGQLDTFSCSWLWPQGSLAAWRVSGSIQEAVFRWCS